MLKYLFAELKYKPNSPIIIGTSAGAINAAYLTLHAHQGFDKAILNLCDVWSNLTCDKIYRTDLPSLLKGIYGFFYNITLGRIFKERQVESLLDASPLSQLLMEMFGHQLEQFHHNIDSGVVKALGISAMQYGTGSTITFYQTGENYPIQPWLGPRREGRPTKLRLKHILASAAIPLLFPTVKLENYYYGDGSVRKMAPLSPAIHLGATRIFAIGLRPISYPSSKASENYPAVSEIIGMMFNTIFLDAIEYDVQVLETMNRLIMKGQPSPAYKKIDVKVVRPSEDLGLMALPFKDYAPRTLNFMMNRLGPTDKSRADFLSYLLFEKHYLAALIERGFQDAKKQHADLQKFFESHPSTDYLKKSL